MDANRFYPSLDALEPRTVPSVTPEQVVGAFVRAEQNTMNIREVAATVGKPRTQQQIQLYARQLPVIAADSRADAAVLDQFRADLLARAAARPAEAPTLLKYAGVVGAVQFDAIVTAAYAELFGPGFGAPPPVPPPPPPVTPTPVDFGTDTAGPLPFPLNDPGFRNIGNGVRVQDVTTGTGDPVAIGNNVTLSYTGYVRATGAVFDSNPAFTTNVSTMALIPGFANGLVGLREGGQRRIDIPAAQAYGANPPAGSSIPPNADLVFDVTLTSINS
ncbi:MAG: FKBP-type peptidyl-prolyl cis-trans isomerase [Gemmataceae bacterium]|nr:FKBP-type peptidyl-prolyl cis-trans isomerase [Gemmataceae bacterium]